MVDSIAGAAHTARVTYRCARPCALGCALALVTAGCSGSSTPSARGTTATTVTAPSITAGGPLPASPFTITAARTPLTNDPRSPVAHDNEVMALASHAGRLFAATDQWMYNGPRPAGQILVKRSASDPWQVFEQTQSRRVEALDSFPIPSDQGLGAGHSLLVTQAIVDGRSEIQWLLDGADTFAPADAFPLGSQGADARAFGAHEDGGVWSVYAGVAPAGILRGTWSPQRRTLVWDPTPELRAAPPRSAGLKTQKVTGFAGCGGTVYVAINTALYRRNDGALAAGTPRWALVFRAPPVGSFNSGIRGLTCVTAPGGAPALLLSTEGNGDVLRLDHLPAGARRAGAPLLTPTLELAPVAAIRSMLAAHGTHVPGKGSGSIDYVIAAYNDVTPIMTSSGPGDVFGFEWGYQGTCPPTRSCGPIAFQVVHFDAAACFAVRNAASRAGATAPRYTLHCLDGPQLTPAGTHGPPIRSGQAFVSIRTIRLSPFGDNRFYLGGYDCNFYPADGTAWAASAPLDALGLGDGASTPNATNEEGA